MATITVGQLIVLLAALIGIPAGIRVMFGEGMLLWPLKWLLDKLVMLGQKPPKSGLPNDEPRGWRKVVAKPLYACNRCMVSVWGIIPAYILTFWAWHWWMAFVWGVAAVGWLDMLDRD